MVKFDLVWLQYTTVQNAVKWACLRGPVAGHLFLAVLEILQAGLELRHGFSSSRMPACCPVTV